MEHPEEAATSTWGRESVCVCVCATECACLFALMLYTSAPNRQTSESTMRDSHVLRAWSVCRKEQQGGKGGGGTQKRCLAGHSSMVGFLHVQFVYLNSFHFNYEGIPFNIWWLLVLPMLVLVMVLLLLLLSQRVVSCPSPLLSCTVLLQLLNVARHARSLSRCRWQHDISTSPPSSPTYLPSSSASLAHHLHPVSLSLCLASKHFDYKLN